MITVASADVLGHLLRIVPQNFNPSSLIAQDSLYQGASLNCELRHGLKVLCMLQPWDGLTTALQRSESLIKARNNSTTRSNVTTPKETLWYAQSRRSVGYR